MPYLSDPKKVVSKTAFCLIHLSHFQLSFHKCNFLAILEKATEKEGKKTEKEDLKCLHNKPQIVYS